jgi:hypothetical protein
VKVDSGDRLDLRSWTVDRFLHKEIMRNAMSITGYICMAVRPVLPALADWRKTLISFTTSPRAAAAILPSAG